MAKASSADRTARRRRLLDLLQRGAAGTQEELARHLARDGFHATQATVSRDLVELGAIRQRRGHRLVWVLPDSNGPPSGLGMRMFPELVTGAVASGNLVVVRTYPGMAPTAAAVIDGAGLEEVVGTVAGDDTVLVVAVEGTAGRALAKKLRGLAMRGAS